jgi:small subunit ribosomal protein S17
MSATAAETGADTGRKPIIKSKVGQVVSDKMEKTIVVRVDTITQHPLYKKRIRRSKKFLVHDEANQAHVGDVVRITETRPHSKLKTWQLADVVRSSRLETVDGE